MVWLGHQIVITIISTQQQPQWQNKADQRCETKVANAKPERSRTRLAVNVALPNSHVACPHPENGKKQLTDSDRPENRKHGQMSRCHRRVRSGLDHMA